jgi:hypothetical protein
MTVAVSSDSASPLTYALRLPPPPQQRLSRPAGILRIVRDAGMDIRPEAMQVTAQDVKDTVMELGAWSAANGCASDYLLSARDCTQHGAGTCSPLQTRGKSLSVRWKRRSTRCMSPTAPIPCFPMIENRQLLSKSRAALLRGCGIGARGRCSREQAGNGLGAIEKFILGARLRAAGLYLFDTLQRNEKLPGGMRWHCPRMWRPFYYLIFGGRCSPACGQKGGPLLK